MRWVVGFWLLSRAIVLVAFALADPRGPADALVHWDAAWFQSITSAGYHAGGAAQQSSLAFFPLFPLLCVPLVKLGVPFAAAGALVANACMLGALAAIFAFVRLRIDAAAARWTVALVALMPLSLFTVAAYSESTYLLLSALALLCCERERFAWAGAWGALATAARPTGIALACAFVVTGLRERRFGVALAGAASFVGIAAFAAYCWRAFGDPLAFVHAQRAWRGTLGVDWAAWWAIAQQAFASAKIVGHAVAAFAVAFVVRRDRSDVPAFAAGTIAVALEAWLWGSNALVALVLGVGIYAVVRFRTKLGAAQLSYAAFALLLFVASGTPFSVDRNAYAILPFDVALALLARRYPALGIPALAAMACGLAVDAAAFARWQWVA